MEKNRDKKRAELEKMRKLIPGKLDHATVAAYEVGHFEPKPLKLTFQDKQRTKQPKQQPGAKGEQRVKTSTKPSVQPNSQFLSLLSLLK